MGNAAFVLIAVGVSAVASLLLWFTHRRPRTFMSSIDDFQREMNALSQTEPPEPSRRATMRVRSPKRDTPPSED
jgi:hypothetical protein